MMHERRIGDRRDRPHGYRTPEELRAFVPLPPRAPPRFSWDGWLEALTNDQTGFTEIIAGFWLVCLYGVVLIIPVVHPGVHAVLDRVLGFAQGHQIWGGTLVVLGLLQVLGPATPFLRVRALVAFTIAIFALTVGILTSTVALWLMGVWAWWGLGIFQTALCWRLLLIRQAEVANGDSRARPAKP